MKSERLFEMLLYLIEKKSVTASELSEHFRVSARIIYRDIDVLSSAGIPVYTTTGNQGGIHLMEHYVLNKNLLTTEEQENILFALHAMQMVSVFKKSFLTSITAVLSKSRVPHSKCRYRLRKSKFVVTTVAVRSSDTKVFEWIKPQVYS